MNIAYNKIGARIQYYRTLQGVSQETLAEAAAVSRVTISNIERGEFGMTADDMLADVLTEARPSVLNAHFDIFGDCTKEETDFLIALLQSIKQVIRKFRIS